MRLVEGMRALAPFCLRLAGAGNWLALGTLLATLTLVSSLGLLSLAGGFLSGAAFAALSPAALVMYNYFLPSAGVRLFALLRTASRWGDRVVTHEGTFRLLAGLRVWLYRCMARQSPRQIAGLHGGEVLNRLVRDIDALDALYPRVLLPTVAAVLAFASVGLVFAIVAPGLIWLPGLLILTAVVLLPLAGWRMGRGILPGMIHGRAKLRAHLIDCTEGLEDFSLHAPAWARQRRETLAAGEDWLGTHRETGRRGAILAASVSLLTGLGAWACLGILADQPVELRPTGPWIVALVLLLLGCAEALSPLAAAAIGLPGTATAARNVDALAGRVPHPVFPDRGPVPGDGSIRIEDLHFEWDAHTPVFQGLNLTIPAGRHVLVTGTSGSGKSTLVQLLTRFENPRSGSVVVGGVPIGELDESTLRGHVSCAGQFSWAKTATLADNLRLAKPGVTDEEMTSVLSLVGLRPDALGWKDGLQTWVEEGGASLSGGQRKRLGIAQALLRDTPITILDEPSEGLDAESERSLMADVTARLRGRTLLWISHRKVTGARFDQTIDIQALRSTG